jgi:hypothetical protein
MAGVTDLDKLLTLLQPTLLEGDFVFCSIPDIRYGDLAELSPLASYQEEEGLSLLLEKQRADEAGFKYNSVFRGITLSVHSSLEAVGFTAAVASKLASNGIPSNVVAAHYHDHVFVPTERAEFAMQLLTELEQ